eukprot:CAMPEP_0194178222 /NCGR_PEP_ID=MMETSP0154-20130528/11871_1 /TAXON_ID=1049557 /ORGANISM="Thalassiothrix antarctica, Strain L6-D1" /LENGTH=422 /DNA_ID=CAMNT_0038893097 /DNA_START=39 /DNA_END=1307 /DNA_ORIENTATION=+
MTSLVQSESTLGISYSHWDWEDDEWDETSLACSKTTVGPEPGEASSLGLVCVTTSAFLFGIVAALIKLIAMNVYVMLLVRGSLQWVFSIVAVCAFMPASTTTSSNFIGEPRHRPILFLRSGLYWGFICLFWSALARLPLGDATTVVYCGPLFTALFGWLLLGEPVPPGVIVCMALSMVGVILVTQPTFLFKNNGTEDPTEDMVQYDRGMLYAFLSAAVGGLLPVLVRKSKECHWATVEHATALCSTAIFTPAALVVMALKNDAGSDESSTTALWEGIHDPRALLLLGLVALVGFAGLGLQTYGYQREAAARASVMNFLEIPFSYVLQYLMFGDLLGPLQGLGMLLVISSGLINFYPRLKSSLQTSDGNDLGTELADCATGPNATQHNNGLHSFRLMNEQSPQTTKRSFDHRIHSIIGKTAFV